MTITRRGWLTILAIILLVAGVPLLAMWSAARDRLPADAVALQEPDAPRWWAEMVQQCLGQPVPYPARAQFYAVHAIPVGWILRSDAYRIEVGGYTDPDPSGRVVLLPGLAHDSSIVIHEALHVQYGAVHPRWIYPTDTTARCGIAAPGVRKFR